MKLRVNDLFDVRLENERWLTEIEGEEWSAPDPLTKTLEFFLKIYNKSQLRVTIGTHIYKVENLPELLPSQWAHVHQAIANGYKHLDLTLQIGDKIKIEAGTITNVQRRNGFVRITVDRETTNAAKSK